MRRLTRRVLIGTGVSVAVLGTASVLACRQTSSREAVSYDRLDFLLATLVDPLRIGRAVRELVSIDTLFELARQNGDLQRAVAYDCVETRRGIVMARVRNDFLANDIVVCDRMVLSRTECIVAGLRARVEVSLT